MADSAIPDRPLCTIDDWLPDAGDPDYEYARFRGGVLRLTRPLAQLLRLMDGRRSVADLAAALTSDGVETSPAEVVEILAAVLVPKGYVAESPADGGGAGASDGERARGAGAGGERTRGAGADKPATPGLWWSTWLLQDRHLDAVARQFAWLFHPWLAVPLFVAGGLFLIWYVATQGAEIVADAMRDPLLFGQVFLLSQAGILWHEIGHAAACARQGVRAGHLGFGFYYLFPAFFVDTNAAWSLRPRRRLWIDLGGLYFTLIFAAVLAALNMVHESPALRVTLYGQAFLFVTNFNPFFRFDGYWAFSDGLNLPNLHGQCLTLLEQAWAKVKRQRIAEALHSLRAAPVITAYIILSAGFFLFFLRTASAQSLPVLLHWPARLYTTGLAITDLWSQSRGWAIPVAVMGVFSATLAAIGTAAGLWLYVIRPAIVDFPRLIATPADVAPGTLTRVGLAALILLMLLL